MLHYTKLERLTLVKHCGLLGSFKEYEENEVLWIRLLRATDPIQPTDLDNAEMYISTTIFVIVTTLPNNTQPDGLNGHNHQKIILRLYCVIILVLLIMPSVIIMRDNCHLTLSLCCVVTQLYYNVICCLYLFWYTFFLFKQNRGILFATLECH